MQDGGSAEKTGALRPVQRIRLYEQLVQRLLQHIRDSGLRAGDRLPPERELAQRLGVSRNSLKQAFVILEVQGMVDIRQGDGTYLRRVDQAESLKVLLDRKQRLPDVLDAREALEAKLAELAALRRTDLDLINMDAALETMHEQVAAGELGAEGDRRFHAAMAVAGHSAVLQQFYDAIASQISETRQESLRQPGRPAQSLAQHQRIVAAVRAGDAVAAVAAVRDHIAAVSSVRLLDWQP